MRLLGMAALILFATLARAGNEETIAALYTWYEPDGTKHISTVPRRCIDGETIRPECRDAIPEDLTSTPPISNPQPKPSPTTAPVPQHVPHRLQEPEPSSLEPGETLDST